jgi:8-amino-7-oxononanoate synthase
VIATANPQAPKMLVIEGVYSMEGHIARLPELTEIAEEHGCFTVLDDAHGFGVLGRQGRGTVDHFGLNDSVDVICGSLSKSLASTGGFVAASRDVIEFLRTHSKQTIFSAAISPSQAAVRPGLPRDHAGGARAPREALVEHQEIPGDAQGPGI